MLIRDFTTLILENVIVNMLDNYKVLIFQSQEKKVKISVKFFISILLMKKSICVQRQPQDFLIISSPLIIISSIATFSPSMMLINLSTALFPTS